MNIKKICILSERDFLKKRKGCVSYDTILGLEDEFLESDRVTICCYSKMMRYINEFCFRVLKFNIPDFSINVKSCESIFFYAAMSLYNLKVNAGTLKLLKKQGAKIVIYCFDTWEPQYKEWDEVLSDIAPSYIFLAYKQSVQFFAPKYKNVFWLPQSMNKKYFFDRKKEKTRMFMQMGRRTEKIHRLILKYLKDNGIEDTNNNYVYERNKGELIFPDTEELSENINATKYFICAPQSYENEKLTGKVSDVTARFYEAMACKSLIIGYKPKVFDELFPYKAMAELNEDGSNLKEIVDYFEKNPDEYNNLVNKNYQYVMENHTWKKRLKYMLNILENT